MKTKKMKTDKKTEKKTYKQAIDGWNAKPSTQTFAPLFAYYLATFNTEAKRLVARSVKP